MRHLFVTPLLAALLLLPGLAGAAGPVVHLTSGPATDDMAAYSPDGSQIAFWRADEAGGIYVMHADGSDVRKVSDSLAGWNPAWSPDGTRLAVDVAGDIELVAADGSGSTNLTASPSTWDDLPHWSSDNRIAYSSDPTGGSPEPTFIRDVYVSNADGTGRVNITNTPGAEEYLARWSPDATRIAFLRYVPGSELKQLVVVRADGSGAVVLGDTFTEVFAWSPDGTRIARGIRYSDGTDGVVVQAADGSGTPVRITAGAGRSEMEPAWSADGRLAFISQDADTSDVYVANADGTGVTNVTATSDAFEWWPSWAPDGSAIVLTTETLDGDRDIGRLALVQAYPFSGFFSPVDNLPVLNSVKAGAAIPVKFSLGGDRGLDVLAAGYPRSEEIACDSNAVVDGIEETVTAGSSGLTYDAVSGRYTYVWKTSGEWSNSCRQLVVKLADGSSHRANFLFR